MSDTAKRTKNKKEQVVQPYHYQRWAIEPLVFIMENNLNFQQGNIIKYVMRYDEKNGIEDLRKAREYLDRWIRLLEGTDMLELTTSPDWMYEEEK
jgi:hypothetical protein